MGEPSFFFTDPPCGMTSVSELECIYQSESGPSMLFRTAREGKFRVLKALKEEHRADPFYQGLLRKEFEIGWELDHPGICKTLDFREVEGLGPCIEMEWVDGRTLETVISEEKPDSATCDKILDEICNALAYTHSKQVLHRDLKPSNILVTYTNNNVKLIDFGLSDSDTHSILKVPAGTINYTAPEVLEGGKADVRSDIYSLGLIMFRLSRKQEVFLLFAKRSRSLSRLQRQRMRYSSIWSPS